MKKFQPKDIIALVVFAGVFVANWRGFDFMIPASLLLIVGYYFGSTWRDDHPGK